MRLGSRNSIHSVDMDDEEEGEEETDDDGDDEQEEEEEEDVEEEIVGSEEVNGEDPQAGEEIVSHSVDDNNAIDQYHPANEGEEVVSADSSAGPVSRLALVSTANKREEMEMSTSFGSATTRETITDEMEVVSGNDERASFESTSSKDYSLSDSDSDEIDIQEPFVADD
jgi:hypothetical protein